MSKPGAAGQPSAGEGDRAGVRQPNAPQAVRGLVSVSPRFWVVAVLIGLGAGAAGAALMLLLYAVQHLAFGYTEQSFLQGDAGPLG